MIFHYSGRTHVDSVPGAAAIDIHDLRVIYDATQGAALQGITLNVPAGQRAALIGPNGAGKSTLLKTLAGIQPYHEGKIRIYGRNVRACHHRVAYVPQRGDIDWKFPISLQRFVLTGRYVHLGWFRGPTPHDMALVERTMARLGLDAVAQRRISDLSGGQQQRALLARAIVQEAELLLLDEPFNNVDPETRQLICTILAELRHNGKSSLVATHEVSRLREDFDMIITLHASQIVRVQTSDEYEQSETDG